MFYAKQLTEHKAIEIEGLHYSIKDTCNYFDIRLAWTTRTDHAGFRFHFDLLGFTFSFEIYDIRHWDYDNGRYVEYD